MATSPGTTAMICGAIAAMRAPTTGNTGGARSPRRYAGYSSFVAFAYATMVSLVTSNAVGSLHCPSRSRFHCSSADVDIRSDREALERAEGGLELLAGLLGHHRAHRTLDAAARELGLVRHRGALAGRARDDPRGELRAHRPRPPERESRRRRVLGDGP